MFTLLLKGFLLFVPTLGIFRFWLVTLKRRFYWANTEIDGNTLEYTGNALQLLIGFMIAVVIFVPIYGGLIYLSVIAPEVAALGYSFAALLLYFLMGYAVFRSRRFRLTRTLWRGIRFHQTGSAWKYAFLRLGWIFLTIITLGLAYPFMAASLWRYRYENTWFGDRRFSFSASWKTLAKPFYLSVLLGLVVLFVLLPLSMLGMAMLDVNETAIGMLALLGIPLTLAIFYAGYLYVQSRMLSRFWSSVTLGDARLEVKVSMGALFLRHLLFAAVFLLVALVVSVIVLACVALAVSGAISFELAQIIRPGQQSLGVLIGMGVLYLAIYGVWLLISELFLSYTFWKIIARAARIHNVDDLRSVEAAGAESPLAGEGLADALNVGAY